MKEEILTVEETARLMRVTRTTVRNWIKEGKLRSFKCGISRRIRKTDIDEMFTIEPKAKRRDN